MRGGSRIFSRGGGADLQKTFKYFVDLFLWVDQIDFTSNPKKNRPKKTFLGTFWKIDLKIAVIFGAHSPSKLVYIGAEGVFRKFLGSVFKNGYFKIVQRGALWVGSGSIPEGG